MSRTPRVALPAWLPLLWLSAAVAQEKPPAPKPADGVTRVENVEYALGGAKVKFATEAGMQPLKDDDGKVLANIFHVSYMRTDGADPAKRPVTFCFNGGPGSSSVWLHMGAFGPKKVPLTDDGDPVPPPAKLIDNDLTLLDQTDLVFIDPVSTGFSRAAAGTDAKRFHGVQEDLASVAEFVRLWLTRHHRWMSPRFVAGESYGTTRAAALGQVLNDRHGVSLNGVILLSAVLNFQTARFDEGNDLPFALYLPTYTATAWYHKKLPAELQADFKRALGESERFAEGEYSAALMKGDRLSPEERKALGQKLARLTGLTEDYLARANYRVEIMRFSKELLRDQRRTVGRFDSRLKGTDLDAAGERHEYDPSYASVQAAYTAGLYQHLRGLLYESDVPYEILTNKVQPWDWNARNRYLNVGPALRDILAKNGALKVFLASGYYDMATPYFASDYTMAHLGLEGGTAGRLTTEYYEAGHMMYTHKPSHEKLKRDLTAFYAKCLNGK